MEKHYSEAVIKKLSDERRNRIKTAKPKLDIKGTTYYISLVGNDDNDGKSPNTAWKTLGSVNAHKDVLKEGDAILFRCGDVFRGQFRCNVKGITYSSFGEGKKPELWGSYRNYAECSWNPTEKENIYVLDVTDDTADIGNIILNHGEKFGYKIISETTPLEMDLDYYHDKKNGKLYFYSEKSAPNERFSSIELAFCRVLFGGNMNDATVDNLCFKYCGDHAIGTGSMNYETENGIPEFVGLDNFTVRNCEFSMVGGGLRGNDTTRLGNGIEIWGGCDNFVVENCYFNEIYDAGLTFQYSGYCSKETPVLVTNVNFSGNLFENCVYGIEYFNTEWKPGTHEHDETSKFIIKNVTYSDNIFKTAGGGFGIQRPDRSTPSHIKSWRHANIGENIVIKNNIFDRSEYRLVELYADSDSSLPKLEGNVYCQYLGKGWIDTNCGKSVFANINDPKSAFAEEDAVALYARR